MGKHTLLRTLTKKSYIKFGQYFDIRVGNLLNLGISSIQYLAWAYYNLDKISFNDDVLKELRISEKLKISKPGKDFRKFYEWKDTNLTNEERLIINSKKTRFEKDRNKSIGVKNNYNHHSKYSLMRKNQGH